MPKITREDREDLSALLRVSVPKDDYEPKFREELGKFRNKAHLKGFRKGRTPLSFIRKMYGDSVLSDIVNDMVQQSITEHLESEKIDILGYPIPAEEQGNISLDPQNLEDYEFIFEIGKRPDFELQGISDGTPVKWHDVQVEEDWVDEEVERMQKWGGERHSVQEPIEEGDVVELSGKELSGDQVREDGLEAKFEVFFNNLTDEAKSKLEGKKAGDTVRLDIFRLEKDSTEQHVRKYFLELQEEDERSVNPEFELKIAAVKRITLAELNQELFDKYFGEGKVSSEEEAREMFRKDIKSYYDSQADSILFREFMDHLYELNDIDLPDAFLKRWLKFNNKGVSDEEIQKNFEDYKQSLKRQVITRKIVQKFDLSVSQEEIMDRFKENIRRYLGGQADDALLEGVARRMMESKEQQEQLEKVADEVMSEKIFQAIRDTVTLDKQPISSEDFKELVEKLNQELDKESEIEEKLHPDDKSEEE